jgi:hypothetical protein
MSIMPSIHRFHREVHAFSVNSYLNLEVARIDHWWAAVTKTNKYPILCKVAWAALTIFHGPKVESTFSLMGDILNPQCSRLKTSSVSAIQTVKYHLKAHGKSAIEYFRRGAEEKVDAALVQNMKMASHRRTKVLEEKKKKLEERKKKLQLRVAKPTTKAEAVRSARRNACMERLRHQKKARQAALEALRSKRQQSK